MIKKCREIHADGKEIKRKPLTMVLSIYIMIILLSCHAIYYHDIMTINLLIISIVAITQLRTHKAVIGVDFDFKVFYYVCSSFFILRMKNIECIEMCGQGFIIKYSGNKRLTVSREEFPNLDMEKFFNFIVQVSLNKQKYSYDAEEIRGAKKYCTSTPVVFNTKVILFVLVLISVVGFLIFAALKVSEGAL